MKTRAVRLYGEMDLRIEDFDLPEITDDEILMKVYSDSCCASTYKAVKQGVNHKRVPSDIATNPIIIGHEMAGEIIKVGKNLESVWKAGDKAVVQPALKLDSGYDPGYSYKYIGGNSTYVVVPKIVLERGCLLPFNGNSYFSGSLVESLACCIRGFKGFYHTDYTTYTRTDGAKRNGKLAILGGAGPMGIGCTELGIGYAGCKKIVITDLNQDRLDYAKSKVTVESAKERGTELVYLNTSNLLDPVKTLIELSDGGFDDVFVMVPVPALFNMAEKICKEDGCINFFAGPAVHDLQGSLNLYRIHYDGIHVVGTAGSIPSDMNDIISLIENKKINAGALVSHILGIKDVPKALFEMEHPNGAKKVCYNHLDIPYVALTDFNELGKTNPLFKELDIIVKRNGGLWCDEAEKYLLANAPKIN